MAVASLVVCAAAVVLWVRSGRGADARGVYVRRAGVRYTVWSEGGRVTLSEPRAAPPPSRRMPYTAATLSTAAAVRNEQVVWQVAGTPWGWIDLRFDGAPGTPFKDLNVSSTAWDLGRQRGPLNVPAAAGATRELLAGLEDPDRFVAGHLALTYAYGEPSDRRIPSHAVDEMPYGQLVQTINGLRVVLRRERRTPDGTGWIWSARATRRSFRQSAGSGMTCSIIRSRRSPIGSWQAWRSCCRPRRVWGPPLWRRLRRRTIVRSRLRRGLCATCAYSLAGNVSGVCPECGTPAAAA